MGLRFEARVFRVAGVQRCVLVPADVVAQLDGGARAPALVRIAHAGFASTLLPAAAGAARLVVPKDIFRQLGWGEDAILPIDLAPDTGRAEPEVSADLLAALDRRPEVRRIFDSQTAATKRQIEKDLVHSKSAGARANRIARLVDYIAAMKLRDPKP